MSDERWLSHLLFYELVDDRFVLLRRAFSFDLLDLFSKHTVLSVLSIDKQFTLIVVFSTHDRLDGCIIRYHHVSDVLFALVARSFGDVVWDDGDDSGFAIGFDSILDLLLQVTGRNTVVVVVLLEPDGDRPIFLNTEVAAIQQSVVLMERTEVHRYSSVCSEHHGADGIGIGFIL